MLTVKSNDSSHFLSIAKLTLKRGFQNLVFMKIIVIVATTSHGGATT